MYLKRLEIAGFKSFAGKTVLEFLPECKTDVAGVQKKPARNAFHDTVSGEAGGCGITAVVGPNGSGKSNIADAIRWAIGEQSAKQLRGKKSEDVIFAGSGKKARLGSASVTLHFDNSDKRIPIDFAEVTVTRRCYRSGESEYLINGSRVRLLDVVDLLAKAGIGKDSHSVITQGESDAVLSATPLERRAILEEAAGVKPYQLERDRALRKLEATRQNIAHVESLMREIEPHLKNLKRQAEKASQSKTLFETLKQKQLQLYGYLWHAFHTEREAHRQELAQLAAALDEAEREAKKLNQALLLESKRVEDQSATDALDRDMQDKRGRLNILERECAIVDGRLEVEHERRKPREVVETVSIDLPYVRRHVEEVRRAQKELITRLGAVEDLTELQELKELARVIETRLAELYDAAGEGAKIEKRVVTLAEEELKHSDARLAQLEKEKKTKTNEAVSLRQALEKTDVKLSQEREHLRSARENFFQLERDTRMKQNELNLLKDRLNDARVRLARVEVREEDLRAVAREELRVDAEQLRYDGEPVETASLEKEVLRLKIQLEHIGGIDPLVLDEYTETEERFAFLSRESQDLKQAVQSLRAVIKEMDDKITVVFEDAFEHIKREFERYFKLIFNGGRAELVKTKIKSRIPNPESKIMGEEMQDAPEVFESDSEEANEFDVQIGVDIDVCPPGKKITSLAMLSGGERSLTSLALLFAIIAHNPPPFAVLDEVEAALDEANSQRFSRMLQEFSKRTQFIVITHNRATMREASLLYGVTMDRDGVSKLLSVHLDQVGQGGKIVK